MTLNKFDKTILTYFLLALTILLLITLLGLALTCIPLFYEKINGEEVISSWIQENIGNETDPNKIATLIDLWIKDNVHYPIEEEQRPFLFYRIDEKLIFWPRNPKYISWTIYKKLGRCEEDAYLFVGIMDRLGYRARVIKTKGWDHAWAEFYPFNDSYKVVVDPSANSPIVDLKQHGMKHEWTKIYALDINGEKEDLSTEYSKD